MLWRWPLDLGSRSFRKQQSTVECWTYKNEYIKLKSILLNIFLCVFVKWRIETLNFPSFIIYKLIFTSRWKILGVRGYYQTLSKTVGLSFDSPPPSPFNPSLPLCAKPHWQHNHFNWTNISSQARLPTLSRLFWHLKPHAKFQNPTIIPSGRKVTEERRQK